MMAMLSPDLLDRRALALIELRDPAGRVAEGPARFMGDGLRIYAKGGGRYAVLGAAGFEDYAQQFLAPSAPAVGSLSVPLDVRMAGQGVLPRRFELKLPRNPDPASQSGANSLFDPVVITLLPAPGYPIPATAAAIRAVVRKRNDGRRVANALVRVASDNGTFRATGMTDASGEALILIPHFPMSFPGAQAQMQNFLPAKASVVADPATTVLVADDAILLAQAAAVQQQRNFSDPDAMASAFPAPAVRVACRLSTRTVATVALEWKAP
jgi:hypothetical protein